MVADNPQHDPIDEEIERVLAENPGLLGRLQEWDRRFAARKAQRGDLLTTEEVRRRLGLDSNPT
jgi:hypothetical protein